MKQSPSIYSTGMSVTQFSV